MNTIRIGTSARGGTFYTQGEAIAAVLRRRGGAAEVRVTPQTGAINAERLEAGEIDFGFIAANWVGRARRGAAPFSRPLGICLVAPMNLGPLFFIARRDSGLASVRDLRGRRVVVGPKDGGMANHASVILGAIGVGPGDFTPVWLDFAEGAEAVASGAADAQLQCPIPNRIMSDLDARVDLKVLDFPGEDLSRVLDASPVHRATTMPAGALRALAADTRQPAVLNVLIAHDRTDPEMVRAVIKAMVEGRDELARANPLFAGLGAIIEPLLTQGRGALEFDGVKLHEAAAEAWTAAGGRG